MECFKCGIDSTETLLYEVISSEGITHACRSCCEDFNYPILNKAFNKILEKPFDNSSARKILNRISGVDVKKSSFNTGYLPPQEKELKELVDDGLKKRIEENPLSSENLIDNFHWVIMRKRRAKKITQKQLAEAINEPEIVIALAEKGKISRESPLLIEKLEKYFSINFRTSIQISKDNDFLINNKGFEKIPDEELSLPLDRYSSKHVTIGELRRIKQNVSNKEPEKRVEKSVEIEEELDQKDINDIIFGRK